jgi:hypothetical protein
MQFYLFLLGTLFVWRVTHLLNAEDGPWDIVVRMRKIVGNGFLGQMVDCFYCLSLWVAIPLAIFLGQDLGERILLWPALSAGAILLERATDRKQSTQSIFFTEESEDKHVMLWPEESPTPNKD